MKKNFFVSNSTAEIRFMDLTGKVLQVAQLNSKGEGVVELTLRDLPSGVYSYSLVVDGQTIDTKKMVFSK